MGRSDRRKDARRILTEDWASIALLSAQIGQRQSRIQIADNHRLGKPWVGSYQRLSAR